MDVGEEEETRRGDNHGWLCGASFFMSWSESAGGKLINIKRSSVLTYS